MENSNNTKIYGAFLDRTLRVVRLDMIQRFKNHDINITPEQWLLISSLAENNGQSQTDLAGGIFKNAPTISRIIDLLCKKGYTERLRFDNDRRRYKIFLTDEGMEVFEKAQPLVQASRIKGWEGLSDEDYENFRKVVDKVFQNLYEHIE